MEVMRFAEWLRHKAGEARALDTEAGDLLAREIERLACDVEFFHAETPAQYQDRKAAYDDLIYQAMAG